MAFLLRVALTDVPGSLGALATALGGAGADIEAIRNAYQKLEATTFSIAESLYGGGDVPPEAT